MSVMLFKTRSFRGVRYKESTWSWSDPYRSGKARWCLPLPSITSGRLRATRSSNCWTAARDVYDVGMFATRTLDHAQIRRPIVLKFWQARDVFDPARSIRHFDDARHFNWDDLRDLLRRNIVLDRERITPDCVSGFGFLVDLTEDERLLANDRYQREQDARERCGRSPLQAQLATGCRKILVDAPSSMDAH